MYSMLLVLRQSPGNNLNSMVILKLRYVPVLRNTLSTCSLYVLAASEIGVVRNMIDALMKAIVTALNLATSVKVDAQGTIDDARDELVDDGKTWRKHVAVLCTSHANLQEPHVGPRPSAMYFSHSGFDLASSVQVILTLVWDLSAASDTLQTRVKAF